MAELLTVIARVRAKAGQESKLREVLKGLVAPTRAEAGCLCYDLHESNSEPGQFWFYEIWKTDADLDAHFETPHLMNFKARLTELVNGEIDVSKCTKL